MADRNFFLKIDQFIGFACVAFNSDILDTHVNCPQPLYARPLIRSGVGRARLRRLVPPICQVPLDEPVVKLASTAAQSAPRSEATGFKR